MDIAEHIKLLPGDCMDVLATLPNNSIDACVTDPPYHLTSIVKRFGADNAAPCRPPKSNLERDDSSLQLPSNKAGGCTTSPYQRVSTGFMGQKWDGGTIAQSVELWAQVYRVLKPGAHLLAFGGTRTYHRMACAIEDAGFEVRDCIQWLYGSGFPKSHDVSKGIDRAAGAERKGNGIGERETHNAMQRGLSNRCPDCGKPFFSGNPCQCPKPEAITDAARQWEGWGTALKPANEPVLLCSKPLTVEQHLAIVFAETNARILQWLNCDANGVAKDLRDFQVRLSEAASSVLDGAKIRSLASIGIAPSAVLAFTFSALASIDQIKTKEHSALSHVRQNGKKDATADQKALHGRADDISTQLLDMSICASMGDITSENIVSLWRSILAELLPSMSKFTIATATKLTTILKILNCSLHQSISNDTGDLSPNAEMIVLARKPLSEKTVAANVLKWGTGAINVGACRVELNGEIPPGGSGKNDAWRNAEGRSDKFQSTTLTTSPQGRWPANVIHDGGAEVLAGFPETQSGALNAGHKRGSGITSWDGGGGIIERNYGNDEGSAARFFYTAKADSDDRIGSKHPTVKPLDLMQYLVRLITPKGGTVLDPFAGTGTTGEAAYREGMRAVLIEREAEYFKDIQRRIELCMAGPVERSHAAIKARQDGKPRDDGPLFGGSDLNGRNPIGTLPPNRIIGPTGLRDDPPQDWDSMWQKPFDKPELL